MTLPNTARSFFSEGYGEQELDANSALMELDKRLRSGKLGEQCEAVVRFPRLFQKSPFPILINAAFLKLADIFRLGNNFLRLCMLKVTQQSEKHLEKILNVDEFVKRIFSVIIHSNDPVARAITLRMLGSMASIFQRGRTHTTVFARAWTLMITWRSKLLFMLLPASPLTPTFTALLEGRPQESREEAVCSRSEISGKQGTPSVDKREHSGNAAASSRPSDLIKLTQECCYHSNRAVAAQGVTVWSNIAISCMEKELMAVEQDPVFGLESLLLMCSLDDSASTDFNVFNIFC
ncbi:integrator complex subunit 7 [Huso huso]|uniref:Integrator complex subunit 7 n=1 Tax=Huso huso TaxID=61971 RepID=A0ABR0ZVT7_HUSHU